MIELLRLLPAAKAAKYCGKPRSTFKGICPVRPIRLHDGDRPKYDIRDLDKWIDSIKSGGTQEGSDDDIANRL